MMMEDMHSVSLVITLYLLLNGGIRRHFPGIVHDLDLRDRFCMPGRATAEFPTDIHNKALT